MRAYPQIVLSLALLGMTALTGAAEPRNASPPPPPPLPADKPDKAGPPAERPGEEAFEPEITITSRGTEIHEEYRHNGLLYMVKVIPAKGPPYYLIYDERGNARRSDIEPDILAPSWVIKRF